MKIRSNYVSNSSSSSFVITGYLINDEDLSRYWKIVNELVPELVKKCNNDFEYFRDEYGYNFSHNGISIIYGNSDNGLPEGKTFIGKFIAKADEDNNFDDIIVDVKDIENQLNVYKNYLTDDESKIKIITGTMLV